MSSRDVIAVACLIALALPVYAESPPEAALKIDYSKCMDQSTAESDPDRAHYCQCVANEIRKWDAKTYYDVMAEQAKAPLDRPVPALANIINGCLAKALKLN